MSNSQQEQSFNKNKDDDDYNVFRDTPIRYLGYANEVGESFRYQFPKLVIPSYVIAFGYCFADAVTCGYQIYTQQQQQQQNSSKSLTTTTTTKSIASPTLNAFIGFSDTMIWQSLASVTIPGATINIIVKASRQAVSIATKQKSIAIPIFVSTWFPTVVGLSSIPFIIHPIDHGVDWLMDSTIRTWSMWSIDPSKTNQNKNDGE